MGSVARSDAKCCSSAAHRFGVVAEDADNAFMDVASATQEKRVVEDDPSEVPPAKQRAVEG